MADLEIEGIGPAELIGGGGSAAVFVATREAFGDRVAVKILKQTLTDSDQRRHFTREVRALQELADVPGVVAVLETGFTRKGEPYLVLPLFADTVQSQLRSGTPYAWSDAAAMTATAARAVGHAHARGIFHRDIKPANLLLTKAGDVFVTDFGIAVLTESSLSASDWIGWTPGYGPPEAAQGAEPSAAWDVYSLGATLAAMVTAEAPFGDSSPIAQMRRILEDPPPDIRQVGAPDGLAQVVEKAMAKDPSDRYDSVNELADAIDAVLAAPGTDKAEADTEVGASSDDFHDDRPTDAANATALQSKSPDDEPTDAIAAAVGATGEPASETAPSRAARTRVEPESAAAEVPVGSNDHIDTATSSEPKRGWLPWALVAALSAGLIAVIAILASGGDDPVADEQAPTAVPATAVPEVPNAPTESPTEVPTEAPEPTTAPTPQPTPEPTAEPTATPVPEPTEPPVPSALTVESGPNAVEALREAIAQVEPGGEITVGPGTYEVDQVILVDRPVTLVGGGVGMTEFVTTTPNSIFLLANTEATLAGMRIVGAVAEEPGERLPLVIVENADATLRDLEIVGSWGDGIFAFGGRGLIETVTVEGNRWTGMAFGGESSMRVTDSVARGNGSGFGWQAEAAGSAEGNTAEGNEFAGFLAEGNATPELRGNTATGNIDGFFWSGQAAGRLVGNAAVANEFAGFLISGDATPELAENTATDNAEGILVEENGAPTLIDNNA